MCSNTGYLVLSGGEKQTQSHIGRANCRASYLVKAQERNGLGRELVSQALGDF